MKSISLTIFTPTFNRAYILKQCYQSLCKQSNKKFIWLIIDDGSQDNTKELVNKWIKENIVAIEYYYQENQGKPSAHNFAIQMCRTEIAVCLDSDDQFDTDAVDMILSEWAASCENTIGILAPKGNLHGISKFYNWPDKKVKYATLGELYYKYGYKGEMTVVFKTKLALNHLFPIYENEKLIGEDYLFTLLDTQGYYKIIKNEFYKWEYLADGYTKSVNVNTFPKSYRAHAEVLLDYSPFFIVRIKAAARLWYSVLIGTPKTKDVQKVSSKLIFMLGFPLGIYLCIKRKVKNEL